MKERFVVAIDGPAGSGKSTVAKLVARRIGGLYVDTGAMYRALTLKAIREGLDLSREDDLVLLARETEVKLSAVSHDGYKVYLDGCDVSEDIRDPDVTNRVKHLARIPRVRKRMVKLQRDAASIGKAVLEGRDIGTVVFPDADVKIFLDADETERAGRRHKELTKKDPAITFEEVLRDVRERDKSDIERAVGPLKQAEDAVRIDTTEMSIEEVSRSIIKIINSRNP